MEMERDNRNQAADHTDGYWDALFQQEEKSLSSLPSIEDGWLPVEGKGDGRLAWPATENSQNSKQNTWETAQEYLESDKPLQLQVTGYNKGGLIVYWNGLQGFVPASQLVNFPQFHVARERMHALADRQDQTLHLKIIEVNQQTNRLILSERAALVEAQERVDLLESLKPGDIVDGKVTNLTKFGVFLDLGGVEGLIHISELSWSRVTHPSEILKPGNTARVMVLSIDQNNERIALSLKRLKQDPWDTAEARYTPGQLVTGTVSNVVNYGAFVLLEEELEGLIHISELAEGSFFHPRNVVQIGDEVTARILSVNGRKKRLALSIRGLQNPIKVPNQ